MTGIQMVNLLAPEQLDFSKCYYYSGPMSGYENFNYPQFTTDVGILRATGLDIESPHENSWPANHTDLSPQELWEAMMHKCLIQMNKCQGIIMMAGWPQSKGAVRELAYATEKEWPVYFYNNYMITSMNGKGVT